jgi:hypothetical protein
LREFCNLGYAAECGRLPQERAWDSIRFGARFVSDGDSANGSRIRLRYVCERAHLPAEHGTLEFNVSHAHWHKGHSDVRLQRMAECFLAAYLEKRRPQLEQAAS